MEEDELSEHEENTARYRENENMEKLHRESEPGEFTSGNESNVLCRAARKICTVVLCLEVSNLRALYVVFFLTTSFTVAQFVGATVANSLSMYGDCFTMAVDSVTYLLNIYAEHQKAGRAATFEDQLKMEIAAQQLDTRVAYISALSLMLVTLYIMYDAGLRLQSEAGVDPVNPQIMYAFSAMNLVMNIISCVAFFRAGSTAHETEKEIELRRGFSEGGSQLDGFVGEDFTSQNLAIEDREQESRSRNVSSVGSIAVELDDSSWYRNLNVFSAFVHLVADSLRSITVFFTSLYVWASNGDSVRADAIGSLIVCGLILIASFFLAFKTWKRQRLIFDDYDKLSVV